MKAARVLCWIVITLAVSVGSPTDVRVAGSTPETALDAPDGWTAQSPRDEIRPEFFYESDGGPNGASCFVMSATGQSENTGQWTRTFPVVGGQHFSFRALRKATGIKNPRRNTMVRITWQDDQGELVRMGSENHFSLKTSTRQLSQSQNGAQSDERENQDPPLEKWLTRARHEFPTDRTTTLEGWTEVADVYLVPPDATQAKIELCLRWSLRGEVRWSEVSFEAVTPPKSRIVRLATVNLLLGKSNRQPTALDACRLHAGPIAEAARQNADIVCLSELLDAKGTGKRSTWTNDGLLWRAGEKA